MYHALADSLKHSYCLKQTTLFYRVFPPSTCLYTVLAREMIRHSNLHNFLLETSCTRIRATLRCTGMFTEKNPKHFPLFPERRHAHLSSVHTDFLCGIQLPEHRCYRVPCKAVRAQVSHRPFVKDAWWFLKLPYVPRFRLLNPAL